MGVGIDYALFMITRFRSERRAGRSVADAAVEMVTHAGRAIAFSGLAVVIGLSALLATGEPTVISMGIGGMVAVLLLVGGLIAFVVADMSTERPETERAIGPMGGAVVDVPMQRGGTIAAGGVEVEGALVEMGIVPLDVTVVPAWTLVNTTQVAIELGEPHASVIEGCCPGPLELAASRLEPGSSTELSFPLQMHVGMDGPHLFAVHVPVGEGDDVLELFARGDFRG